jgi:hypothetical protein
VIEGATDTSATNPPHIPTQWRLKNKPVRNISPSSIRYAHAEEIHAAGTFITLLTFSGKHSLSPSGGNSGPVFFDMFRVEVKQVDAENLFL